MKRMFFLTTLLIFLLSLLSIFAFTLKSTNLCYRFLDQIFSKNFSFNNICRKDTLTITTQAELIELLSNIEKYKYTKELTIKNLDLTSVPIELAKLENLEYLDLGGNNITDFPIFLENLGKLKILYLHDQRNGLKVYPKSVVGYQNLKALELGGNSLEEIPSFIYNLKGLRYLNIESNKIPNIPQEINNLENLQLLNILDNPIKSITLTIDLKYLLLDENLNTLVSNLNASNIKIYNYNYPFNIEAFSYDE